jgi:hypothetical protein
MTYSYYEHRHKFAVWCAARAVQRNFTKSPILKEALESSGVVEFIKENEERDISQNDYDKHHETWCHSIMQTWQRKNIKGASYGRAAKLLAVYIKAMIVVRNNFCRLAVVAHPPIDRRILKNISKDTRIIHQNKHIWKEINWTEMNESAYKNLIHDFRGLLADEPFWQIEKYWSATDD